MALPSDLTRNERFKAVELKTPMAVTLSTANIERIKQALEESAANKTLKVHLSLSGILDQLGPHKVLRYNPETQQLDLVCLLTEEDTFPEPAAFSRSSAVIVWRENKKPATTTGAEGGAAERQEDDREVLLVTEANVNRTSFVAGGQKPCESSLQGAAREVKEETGLDLDLETAQWMRSDEMGGAHGEHNTLNTFAVKVKDPNQEIHMQQAEIKEAGWHSIPDALERMSLNSAKRALAAFRDGWGVPVEAKNDRQLGWQVAGPPAAPAVVPPAEPAVALPASVTAAQPAEAGRAQPAHLTGEPPGDAAVAPW